MDADELYTIKNNFWLGNFEAAITEARSLKLRTEAAKAERDCYIYRSFIGLRKYKVVIDEIKDDAPAAFTALKLLAAYFADAAGAKSRVLGAVDAMVADAAAAAHPIVQLVAATVYLHESQFASALKVLSAASLGIEGLSLLVQAQLRIDRPDLAEATYKRMTEVDDESALTMLCLGLLRLTQGGERVREAALTYKELNDRFGPSSAGLNGLLAASIALRKYDDAEKALAEATGAAAGTAAAATGGASTSSSALADDPETLINAIALYSATGALARRRRRRRA